MKIALGVNLLICACMLVLITTANAATIIFNNNDGPGEGLNDPTPVSALPGNPATTQGAQFLNVFEAAADYWEARLNSPVPIEVDIQLDPLSCVTNSGTLGSAGPNGAFRNFANAPLSGTWYPSALANSLAGLDLDVFESDLNATFNDQIGTPGCLSGLSWWLGIDAPAPAGTISFFDTILHEIGHGIGFLTFVNSSGSKLSGFDDTFMLNLTDKSTGKAWPTMSNGERAASSTNTGNLVWSGANVTQYKDHIAQGVNTGNLQMFAPAPYQNGSSVSHWDTQLNPDELMEPSATPTSDDCSTILALKDMGWNTFNPRGELQLTASAYQGSEVDGSVTIEVSRPNNADCGAVSINVQSSDGSATAGIDYVAVNQVLTWANGEVGQKTVDITLLDDGVSDDNETFSVSLSLAGGGASIGARSLAQVQVYDADIPVDEGFCTVIKTGNGKFAVVCL